MQQISHKRPGGRLIADLLRGQMLGGEQRPQRLVVAASLAMPASHIDQVLRASLHDRQVHRMHRLGVLDGCSPSPRVTAAETRWTPTLVGPKAVKKWLASTPSRRAVLLASFSNARLVIGSLW
jgi:hypothetical protein